MQRRVAAILLAASAVAPAAPAGADPIVEPTPVVEPTPAPAPPAPADLLPAIGGVLSQVGNPAAGPFGLPDLSAYGTNLVLGQNAAPAPPGAPAAAVPNLNAFAPEYLLPQNVAPAAPDEGTAAPGLAPNADIAGTGRIAFLRRIYEMYQEGSLKGALLGQNPPGVLPAETAPPTG